MLIRYSQISQSQDLFYHTLQNTTDFFFFSIALFNSCFPLIQEWVIRKTKIETTETTTLHICSFSLPLELLVNETSEKCENQSP